MINFHSERRIFHIANCIAADGLATLRARASAAMGLTYFSWNILDPILSIWFNFNLSMDE